MNTRSLVVTGHFYIGAHIIRDYLIIIDNNVSTGKAVFLSYLLWHYCTISTVAGSRVTRGPSDDANWALVTGHGDSMLLDFGSRPVT